MTHYFQALPGLVSAYSVQPRVPIREDRVGVRVALTRQKLREDQRIRKSPGQMFFPCEHLAHGVDQMIATASISTNISSLGNPVKTVVRLGSTSPEVCADTKCP